MPLMHERFWADEFPDPQKNKKLLKSTDSYFFLSHAHSDHTRGLKRLLTNYPEATIVCSRETKVVLELTENIPPERFMVIEKEKPLSFNGVTVTAFEANHCIGSLMFLFESEDRRELFTGDFRYDPEIMDSFIPQLVNVDRMVADGTYNRPIFHFPSQKEAIDKLVKLTLHFPFHDKFIGSYHIGKEKIFTALHRLTKQKIWATPKIKRIYEALGYRMFTEEPDATNIFLAPRRVLESPRSDVLRRYPHRKRLTSGVKMIPTGWAVLNESDPKNWLFWIPYSEHCSRTELKQFLEKTAPKTVTFFTD